MDADVYLRCASESDAPALARLRTASAIELGWLDPRDAAPFEVRARRIFGRLMRDDRISGWVLVADGEVAGCACVVVFERLPYPETSLHAELAGVYVAPALRRRGYARELIAEAIASAQALGVRRTFIAATGDMRAYYESLGFAPSNWLASTTAPRITGAPSLERSPSC